MAKRVLIVEDNPLLQETLQVLLRKAGIEYQVALNGAEAMERLQSFTPDVIFLDLVMPVMDGYQVLELLRARDHGLPIIIMTNLDRADAQQKCLELGATDFVVKSDTSVQQIKEKIAEYLI